MTEAEEPQLRRFYLQRNQDPSGTSGTGIVADGVAFPDGSVVVRWRGAWPTSVVFHERGIASVEKVHGHGGATKIVWLDSATPTPTPTWQASWRQLEGWVNSHMSSGGTIDPAQLERMMYALRREAMEPVRAWLEADTRPEIRTPPL